jgi:hypothetical protein
MPWATSSTAGSEDSELTLQEFRGGIRFRCEIPAITRSAGAG